MAFQMEQCSDGIYSMNLQRTWEKPLLAAQTTVTTKTLLTSVSLPLGTPASCAEICHCQRGCSPGTFTNQIQAAFRESHLLAGADPRVDPQPLMEVSYINLATTALRHTDSPLSCVDIAIPCYSVTQWV